MQIKKLFILNLVILLGLAQALPSVAVMLRLKDITHIHGVRENQLVGYGMVVGLDKSGDKSRSTQFGARNLLMNFGTVLNNANDISSNNIASVIVTATVPAFAKSGDRIDVLVSSMADAKSLEGGVLVQTQLLAANGEVVAIAQGPVSTGGTSVDSSGSSTRTSITTSARIPNGAIIERDMQTAIGDPSSIELILNQADFGLAAKISDKISNNISPSQAVDAGMIRVNVPDKYTYNPVPFVAILQALEVDAVNESAKVVINERTGTVVIGNHVHLQPAAIAHGGITVSISASNEVSQPNVASNGQTLGATNANIDVEEKQGSLVELNASATLQDLVNALNALGATPSDLITILQALKQAGSLNAELEII